MTPVKPELYEYEFRPSVIKETRGKLGLSQAKLADLLDVPVNTLSRWESGSTSPDAKSLAAIFSIAKGKGITPQFFVQKASFKKVKDTRTRLLFAWDFQNLGMKAEYIKFEWEYMFRYLKLFHPSSLANRTYRAYISPNQRDAGEILSELKFEVQEGYFDADRQIINDSFEDCETNPQKWSFILLTDDGDYTQLFKDMQSMGIDTYIWGSDNCSERLIDIAGTGHFIHWDTPYVVMTCMDIIKRLNGKQITRSQFGQMCKDALDEEEIYPDEVGFSRKNPYGSLLRWLFVKGVVAVNEIGGKSDKISIVAQG